MPKEGTARSMVTELRMPKTPEKLEGRGTYTLVVFVSAEMRIGIGSLGAHRFRGGYYAYTGSAFGEGALSLSGRVRRHLGRSKKKLWHIDHLLSENNVVVRAVVAAHTKRRMECEINRYLKERLQAEVPVPRFGSSDCKEDCKSHLLYLGLREQVARTIAELYSKKAGEVHLFNLR